MPETQAPLLQALDSKAGTISEFAMAKLEAFIEAIKETTYFMDYPE